MIDKKFEKHIKKMVRHLDKTKKRSVNIEIIHGIKIKNMTLNIWNDYGRLRPKFLKAYTDKSDLEFVVADHGHILEIIIRPHVL